MYLVVIQIGFNETKKQIDKFLILGQTEMFNFLINIGSKQINKLK